MSKQTIIVMCIFLALVLTIVVLVKYNADKNETIAALERKIALLGQETPSLVTITDNEVSIQTPTKTSTQYKPSEGKVSFDTAKYRSVVARLDSLLRAAAQDSINKVHAGITSPGPNNVNNNNAGLDKPAYNGAVTFTPFRDRAIDSLRTILMFPEKYGIINIQTKGVCFRPMIGCGYNGEFDGVIGAKIAFWNRYGIMLGSTQKQAGIGITRRLDDALPFTYNTEAILMGGVPYKKNDGYVFVGIGVGL